jgi:hypothetical protein
MGALKPSGRGVDAFHRNCDPQHAQIERMSVRVAEGDYAARDRVTSSKVLPSDIACGMLTSWDAKPIERTAPDPFTTATASALPATEEATESEPRRYVLPKNLRNAVKHLSDGELDLMRASNT